MRYQPRFSQILAIATAIPLLASSTLLAQSKDNWNRFDQQETAQAGGPQGSDQGQGPSQAQGPDQAQDPIYAQQNGPGGPPPPAPNQGPGSQGAGFPHFPDGDRNYDRNNSGAAPSAVPQALNIPAGKYLVVRTTTLLSSDRNQPGDAFSATLAEPLVVDGFVVAQRGQTVNGRVVDVEKAGRVKGTSSLRVELTELNLVDGQQIPFKSQLINRRGETTIGRDVAGVGTTTALGAAIGAGVNGGVGSGVGAGAGAIVGLIGVLTTRGRPTVVYPETVLTFRVEQPLTISTVRNPNAFETVSREDYTRPVRSGMAPGRYAYGPAAGPAPYPYYGAYPYYGGFWGPSLYVGGFYGRGFYGRGWGRRW